ncbi:hypothetical protein F3157_05070 [Virgibacillus dakarensis]|uniref:Uncharacterized protein n=1 Tax=Lentibacillus populi TaxID=1827502 RepID=A0A9W5TVJ4_9BACI|nr:MULTISPECIES: hypothetical protein [Bacillaceae]MBT2214352.1 hypothetical protein [Virgibacillus dakarensis]MTW85029.1 hypothetical protein [Virgibacillus dakarensis]GGB34199.1 hypothetical protein GCM10011409_09550 [Lentibacillus populi]
MASTYSAIACPHCGCCATEDYYYKTWEKFIWCYRCGYSYEKTIDYWKNANEPVYSEREYKGHGMCLVHKRDKKGFRKILHRTLTSEETSECLKAFLDEDVDLKESYFVTFENGIFTTLAGTPPKDFYLPYDEYKEKKEANNQQLEIILPGIKSF